MGKKLWRYRMQRERWSCCERYCGREQRRNDIRESAEQKIKHLAPANP